MAIPMLKIRRPNGRLTVRAKKILPSWRQPEGAAKSRSQFLSADGGFRRSAHPSVWHAIYASRRELKAPPIDIGR